MIEYPTNIGHLDHKMLQLRKQIQLLFENIEDPIAFMSQVDSVIQALRNYTFALQKNKSNIPEFESWYGPWQEFMKTERHMKWVASIRTGVVHDDVLATSSKAKFTIDSDHRVTEITDSTDVMDSTEDIIKKSRGLAKEEPYYKHATVTIHREYLSKIDGQDIHVVDILRTCYIILEILRIDLSKHLSSKKTLDLKKMIPGDRFYVSSKIPNLRFRLKDGELAMSHKNNISKDELKKYAKKAKSRYGDLDHLKEKIKSQSKQDVVKGYFELAKTMLEKDGDHPTTLFIDSIKNGNYMIRPILRDRSDKIAFWRDLAKEASDINEVIVITETWTFFEESAVEDLMKYINEGGPEPEKIKAKKEALMVQLFNSKGDCYTAIGEIKRTKSALSVAKPYVSEGGIETYYIYYPMLAAWGIIEEEQVNDRR